MGGISHHRFDRNVVRKHFIVRVQNRAAFRVNDLFVNVLLSRQSGVLIVLDDL